ncbi:MAG: sialate O-acetylesterase [bacterium]|nr:sialate O-acetylesterase [bacterium]
MTLQHSSPLPKPLTVVLALLVLAIPCLVHAGTPHVRFRAALGVALDATGVREWKDPISGITATVAAGQAQPTVTPAAINGKPTLTFVGTSYLTVNNAECFMGSYSLYVVLKHNGVAGSNNIVSGNQHAFWLGNTVYPHVLHNTDFTNQSVSNVPLSGWCVVRVIYDAFTGVANIAVNNQQGASDVVPLTNDPTFLIAAFAASNNFNGDIAEVVYYKGAISDADREIEDNRLHTFYNIARVPDPLPPIVTFSISPKRLQLIPIGDSIRVDGFVVDPSILTVGLTVDSNGVEVDQRNWTIATDGPNFVYTRGIPNPGIQRYRVVVTAARSGTRDTVLKADSIMNGVVLAISGQSNSVFGDPAATRLHAARTFGANFSQSAADTLWSYSNGTLYGGGSTVGATGMYLQAHLYSRNMPSAVINGGVGGTTIQQHLRDPLNHENRSTIHGSWAYRRRVANVNKYINWMYWYQGESNTGNEDYSGMFDSLYTAWHEEMPNLKRIMFIQVHPGCGGNGNNHALLREKQRLFQKRYADVAVIAASGLPGHDGCHYTGTGYSALGAILAHHLDSSGFDASGPLSNEWSSPDISSATFVNEAKTQIRLRFLGYANSTPSLRMTPDANIGGVVRTSHEAFFANSTPAMRPTSVELDGNEVKLRFAQPVTSISYIPGYGYFDTPAVIYEGPWLTNARGVGALTFLDFPVSVISGVDNTDVILTTQRRLVDIGDNISFANLIDNPVRILDMRGAEVYVGTLSNGTIQIPALASAPYLIVSSTQSVMVIVR